MRTNDDPYRLPELYDMEYAGHDEDVQYYVRRATAQPGNVLELGCGTGRLTLPIARAGRDVMGVDYAEEMLELFATKLKSETPVIRDHVQLLQADFRDLPDVGPFNLILWPFNALHHCPDVAAMTTVLKRCKQLLKPGGQLALDAYLVDLSLYDRNPEDRFEERTFLHPKTKEKLFSWEQGWWDAEAKIHHVLYVYQYEDGREERSHLQLRMFDLEEIYQALHDADFELQGQWQDFAGTALGPRSLKWVAITKPVV